MQYVIIGVGCKHIFSADNKYKALEKARFYARDLRLTSWLLYNRNGDLIYASYSDGLPSSK